MRPSALSLEDQAAARQLYERDGLSASEIGSRYGVSKNVVVGFVTRQGWKRRGEDGAVIPHRTVQLSPLRDQARAMAEAGESLADIGRALGLSLSTLSGWAQKYAWAVQKPQRAKSSGRHSSGSLPPDAASRKAAPTAIGAAKRQPVTAAVAPMGVSPAPQVVEGRLARLMPALPGGPGYRGGCHWPLWGNERPTHCYCNARRAEGRPYCPAHCAVAARRVGEVAA